MFISKFCLDTFAEVTSGHQANPSALTIGVQGLYSLVSF